jgi:NADH:ubiquinone oxidoreductase subunit 6 (subunit J)
MPPTATQSDAQAVSTVLFYAFALMSAGSAIGLVLSRNIVRTAVCLLFTLLGVAGLYFLLNAEFLAAVQLVVYAGGTLILIVFGVMLTSKSPFSRFEPKLVEIIIAISVGSILLVALIAGIVHTKFATNEMPAGIYPVDRLGQTLLGDFLVPFELSSVLLLVVMIGAAYLAKGRRRETDSRATDVVSREASRVAREWT